MDFDKLRITLGLVGTGVAAVWGSIGVLVQVLLILMAIDFATGLIAAWMARELDSWVGWRGLGRKMLTLGVVACAAIVEPVVGGIPVAQAVAGFYAMTEVLSVIENAARSGVPIPKILRDALVKARNDTEGQAIEVRA